MGARVVGLGLCVVDHLYVVESLDGSQVRTRFSDRRVVSGGMTGTALAQAATLGCEAHALTLVGDDAEGRFVRRALRGFGVKTRRILVAPEAETTVAVVLVDRKSGERRFLVPDRRPLERTCPDFDLSVIDRRTVLLVDGHFPEQALRAVRHARRVGARVVGDFHRVSPAAMRLLPHVDYPIVPSEFAETLCDGGPEAAVRELAERFGGSPVVTLGAEGGIAWRDGRPKRFRARRVRVRDTTGAGDVFHGAFAAALTRELSIDAAIALATRAAAQCCTALGGTGNLLGPDAWQPRVATPRNRAPRGARGRRG